YLPVLPDQRGVRLLDLAEAGALLLRELGQGRVTALDLGDVTVERIEARKAGAVAGLEVGLAGRELRGQCALQLRRRLDAGIERGDPVADLVRERVQHDGADDHDRQSAEEGQHQPEEQSSLNPVEVGSQAHRRATGRMVGEVRDKMPSAIAGVNETTQYRTGKLAREVETGPDEDASGACRCQRANATLDRTLHAWAGMEREGRSGLSPIPQERRQSAIGARVQHYAADHVTVEEFERRVDVAHRTRDPA